MAPNKQINLVGQKFVKLTVISKANSILGGDTVKRYWGAWNCLCDCGNNIIVKTVDLNKGSVKSCGCLIGENGVSYKPGDKINRLTTISYKKGGIWICHCECGNIIEVPTGALTSGNTKSCGCLKTESSKAPDKLEKLFNGRRKNSPQIASARRVWKGYCYRDDQCNLTFEQFLKKSQQNCYYCGIEPNTKYNHFSTTSSRSSQKAKEEGLFIYNGLDRINSTKYHTIDNVVSCCYDCNRAKNNRTTDQFLQWINQLIIKDFLSFKIINIEFPTQPLAGSVKSIFYGYKKDTDMTVEQFYTISQMNCFYCNNAPNNFFDRGIADKKAAPKTKEKGSFYYNGLDRIDRTLPHNKDNVVPCCYYCNFAKGKLTLLEFQDWIKRIQQFQKEKALTEANALT